MRPKFTHLQYLLGARVSVTVFLSAALLAITGSAAASDLPSPPPSSSQSDLIFSDGNIPLFPFLLGGFNGLVVEDDVEETGEARGLDLVRRAPAGTALGNNQFQMGEISMGDTQWWHIPKDNLDGKAANSTSESQSSGASERALTDVYLSLTICTGPSPNKTNSKTAPDLPQLEVYVSLSESLQKPGPGKDNSKQNMTRAEEGYMGTIVSTASDIYIGVAAPENSDYFGSYSYQIAVSTDAFFHSYDDSLGGTLEITDTSSNAALITTINAETNLTPAQLTRWNNHTSVYTMFAYKVNTTASPNGLQRSYCALKRLSQVSKGNNLDSSMTTRNNGLQQQFYITDLNRSTTYVGILAIEGNSTDLENGIIGGGGKVFKQFDFKTKTDDNCALLFNLDFCTEIAQAVPAKPSINLSTLRTLYDDHTASLYQNFNYSLQQVQCTTSNESIYSMAVTCADCDKAYRNWLCAVTIPHCDDFYHDTGPESVIRNAGQPFLNGTNITDPSILNISAQTRSRNSWIDEVIQPGPYREILPRLSICYDLVKTCPLSLGFGCPTGKYLKYSYSVSSAAVATFLRPSASLQMLFSAIPVLCAFFWLF